MMGSTAVWDVVSRSLVDIYQIPEETETSFFGVEVLTLKNEACFWRSQHWTYSLTGSKQQRKDAWCIGKFERKTSLGVLGTDRMVLKLVLNKLIVRVWAGFNPLE
jgi:hypothetical protein